MKTEVGTNGATKLSRMNFSGNVGHVTIFSWMFTITCCSMVRVRTRFSIWLVRGYAHVIVLLSVVTVRLPRSATTNHLVLSRSCLLSAALIPSLLHTKIWTALPGNVASASTVNPFWHQLKIFQQSSCFWYFNGPRMRNEICVKSERVEFNYAPPNTAQLFSEASLPPITRLILTSKKVQWKYRTW